MRAPEEPPLQPQPHSQGHVQATPSAPVYSFTPPKVRQTSSDSSSDFDQEFSPLGSRCSGPRKKSFPPLSAAAISPTHIQSPPPSETTEVLSPSPTRMSKSKILLDDTDQNDGSELLFEGPELSSTLTREPTPRPRANLDVQTHTAPDKIRSPFYPQYPCIVDPASLKAATQIDPQRIFDAIQTLVNARDSAQSELRSVKDDYRRLEQRYMYVDQDRRDVVENYEGARLDHKSAQDTWDRLLKIEKGKQVLLWKFIDQLQRGDKSSGPLDGLGQQEGQQVLPSSRKDERRNAVLKQALDDAIGAAEGEPLVTSSISNLQTTSTDGGNTDGIAELVDWKMRGTLDPSAETFVPLAMATISDSKLVPTAPIDGRRSRPNEISGEELNEMIASVPIRFQGVCPFSLTSEKACPLQNCQLSLLCTGYNDESIPGCRDQMHGSYCPKVHEYRTCEKELNNERCPIASPAKGDRKKQGPEAKKSHMRKRIHRSNSKEWMQREAVARLRDLHLEGRYNE